MKYTRSELELVNPTPKMTKTQVDAMISFHRRAQTAYRKYGKPEQAEQAKKQREKLEVSK